MSHMTDEVGYYIHEIIAHQALNLMASQTEETRRDCVGS